MFCPESYSLIASFFPRLLGIIYFFAITALFFQIQGLVGKNGILPIKEHLDHLKGYAINKRLLYFNFPTLLWFDSSDRTLLFLTGLGMVLSLILALGFLQPLMLLLLYILYLSLKVAGQDFLSFGWEGLLLEITVQTFLMSLTAIPNLMIWISINFLLFRFHFQAGITKLQTRDPTWRNLTALAYHYQTQPLPNTVAWFIHKMPLWFHKLSTALVLIIEIIIPFGIFLNEDFRFFTFVALIGLQFMIWLTGNFSFLNYLTASFSTLLISNNFLVKFIDVPPILSSASSSSVLVESVVSLLGTFLIVLQMIRLGYQIYPSKYLNKILYWEAPFHLANRYAIFANMTTERYEVIIEGSEDGKDWKEYSFRYKPSEVTSRPKRISPYQPRIDWQIWFLPFRDFYTERWFQKFLYHLLKGTPDVLSLVKYNPFPNQPPKYVRSFLYLYEFTSFKERQEKGSWWKRQLIELYSPVMKLTRRNESKV